MWNTPGRPAPAGGTFRLEPETYDLTRLLPSSGPVLTVRFRTLNGFQFQAVRLPPGAAETAARCIRRVFEIQPPAGEPHHCAVEITPAARSLIFEATGCDFAPDDPVWDLVSRTSLCAHLWEGAEPLPETLLIYRISREQREAVRAMTHLETGDRRP